jgi:methylmalonyl-CoA mutase cobalamin-binding subunit
MRDNGIPEARGQDGLDWFSGLAQEALGRLVSVRDQQGVEVRKELLDLFLDILAKDSSVDPAVLLHTMVAQHLDPEIVACGYAGEAARALGEGWLSDELSFVDVTVRSERLHALVRQVDEMLVTAEQPEGPSALVLVAEAEQHTLGAFVLALQLRLAGVSAIVRVAPAAADLTVLMAANRFDLALVSIGCTAGLESGVGLVRMLRLMSRGGMRIYVGGAVPVDDAVLLTKTGADRVLRDVSVLLSDFDASVAGRALEPVGKRGQRNGARSSVKGDQGDT